MKILVFALAGVFSSAVADEFILKSGKDPNPEHAPMEVWDKIRSVAVGMYSRSDLDDDGFATMAEEQKRLAQDSSLSSEKTEYYMKQFRSKDANKDGKVSYEEMYWFMYAKYWNERSMEAYEKEHGPIKPTKPITYTVTMKGLDDEGDQQQIIALFQAMQGVRSTKVARGKGIGTQDVTIEANGYYPLDQASLESEMSEAGASHAIVSFDSAINELGGESDSESEEPKMLAESQEWTNKEGQKITAAVKKVEAGKVYFVMEDGKEVPYPVANLSQETIEKLKWVFGR